MDLVGRVTLITRVVWLWTWGKWEIFSKTHMRNTKTRLMTKIMHKNPLVWVLDWGAYKAARPITKMATQERTPTSHLTTYAII